MLLCCAKVVPWCLSDDCCAESRVKKDAPGLDFLPLLIEHHEQCLGPFSLVITRFCQPPNCQNFLNVECCVKQGLSGVFVPSLWEISGDGKIGTNDRFHIGLPYKACRPLDRWVSEGSIRRDYSHMNES